MHYLPAMNKTPGNLIKHLKTNPDIPELSSVAQTYLKLIRQTNPDIGTVADALVQVPGAERRIITLANSELFVRHRHSTNLQQAIANLGVNETLILSVACEAFTTLRTIPADSITRDTFEQRACIAATWGKILGNEFGRRDSAALLLAAMIRNVGPLLIPQAASPTYADQHQASAWLAEKWQLPDKVIRTLRLDQGLEAENIPHDDRGFYRAVNFCGHLAESWCHPLTPGVVEQIAADAQRYLGISPDQLAELCNTAAKQVIQLAPILGLDTLAPNKYETITQQIRDLLPTSNVRTLSVYVSRGVYAPRVAPATLTPSPGPLDPTSFAARLDDEFTLAARHGWPLSLLLVEIDDFKRLNECQEKRKSAQTQDNIATLLSGCIRSSDAIATQGVGRFAILLPGIDAGKAAHIAQRLVCEARRTVAHDENVDRIAVTVSLGIATLNQNTPFSSPPELRSAASAALEFSINTGRNRQTAYTRIRAA